MIFLKRIWCRVVGHNAFKWKAEIYHPEKIPYWWIVACDRCGKKYYSITEPDQESK